MVEGGVERFAHRRVGGDVDCAEGVFPGFLGASADGIEIARFAGEVGEGARFIDAGNGGADFERAA